MSETTQAEPSKTDAAKPKIPAWFGPGVIRAMKNDFLAHMENCDKCAKAEYPDETCEVGMKFVDALGMDKPTKTPTQTKKKIAESKKASAFKKAEFLKAKLSDLESQLTTIEDANFEKIKAAKARVEETRGQILKVDADIVQETFTIGMAKARIEKIQKELEQAKAGLDLKLENVDILKGNKSSLEDVLANRIHEFKKTNVFETPIVQKLEKDRAKLKRRLEHHVAIHAEIFAEEIPE